MLARGKAKSAKDVSGHDKKYSISNLLMPKFYGTESDVLLVIE